MVDIKHFLQIQNVRYQIFEEKDFLKFMFAINKAEKEAIIKRFPGIHIVRTMKKKSKRHHYYCEESPGVAKLLSTLRGTDSDKSTNKKGDGRYKSRKNV